ncbi:hypothetical protein B0T26DRAFT_703919 [Lasiosphaeria miniovina]|uniref:Uncharacterized protein n=1 Tax=Lasiosphaeria miniovina TaxID=1954250 RepID=A0AA40AVG7_9PEZI|nr:uncharacterized protein B0T26DRAFT_703919 [Lasiosphaeria miniovina]KAK0722770.1 hypothetical protein B0T26DRAFT_703919 [Lasiosphaeria miniovina]
MATSGVGRALEYISRNLLRTVDDGVAKSQFPEESFYEPGILERLQFLFVSLCPAPFHSMDVLGLILNCLSYLWGRESCLKSHKRHNVFVASNLGGCKGCVVQRVDWLAGSFSDRFMSTIDSPHFYTVSTE